LFEGNLKHLYDGYFFYIKMAKIKSIPSIATDKTDITHAYILLSHLKDTMGPSWASAATPRLSF
jgi:hypothetical protein